ncbi:hypothetical protein ANO11243_055860 [Dothideomycetidae sp. 11243]|nr:hypothetical protein ANO11243_055860 [fungal sp. No.11243]
MDRHNLHRANHGADAVHWDPKLERAAMKSAQRCTFAHFMGENGLSYGQNLALGLPATQIADIVTSQWYSEVNAYAGDYGQADPNMSDFGNWGHFTQVVWKNTARIGCATWHCDSVATSATDPTPLSAAYGGDITYCNYEGPGNYVGEFAANVGMPQSVQNIKPDHGVDLKAIASSYSKWTGQTW